MQGTQQLHYPSIGVQKGPGPQDGPEKELVEEQDKHGNQVGGKQQLQTQVQGCAGHPTGQGKGNEKFHQQVGRQLGQSLFPGEEEKSEKYR